MYVCKNSIPICKKIKWLGINLKKKEENAKIIRGSFY